MERRTFIWMGALAAAGVACAREPRGPQPPFPALADELAGIANDLNVFPGGQEFLPGADRRFPFGLADLDGFTIEGGEPRVWIGVGETADGPFEASWHAYADPRPGDGTGYFVTTLPMPGPGIVTLVVERDGIWGSAVLRSQEAPRVPGVGARAPVLATPTFGHPRGVARVCTRPEEPCPMHEARLDRVAGEGVVVLTIASPEHCSSRTCGPVVDEITAVRARHPGAAYIHAEPFADEPPVLSPTGKAFDLDSEPWTFVIDRDGVIAERFEGPVDAGEVEDALLRVL